MNTKLHIIYNILSEVVWWVLFNTSSITWIYLVVPQIIANETCSYW